MRTILLQALILLCAASSFADVTLPHILGNNMVLQSDAPIKIWGMADPDENVTVSFRSRVASATTGADGHWQVELGSFSQGGPYEMEITGNTTITLTNILCGEVWVGSGQSNMAGRVYDTDDIATADYDQIRFFVVPAARPGSTPAWDTTGGEWIVCSPATVDQLSAVLYYFAREIHLEYGFPMGCIVAASSNTAIQEWVGKVALENAGLYQKDYGKLYHGMIAPLHNHAAKGVLWYQGEKNADVTHSQPYLNYEDFLSVLIEDWGKRWNADSLFFGIVQLQTYESGNSSLPVIDDRFPWVRNAQIRATENSPNSEIAVIMDLNPENSIHPSNKPAIAYRLVLPALAKVYGETDLVYSGPIFTGSTIEGNTIRISFKHTGSGLVANGGGPLEGFAIEGNGQKAWAQAQIEGETVVVSSPSVPNPEFVYYNWKQTPVPLGNLYNVEGLPASPFRTNSPLQDHDTDSDDDADSDDDTDTDTDTDIDTGTDTDTDTDADTTDTDADDTTDDSSGDDGDVSGDEGCLINTLIFGK